MNIGPHSSRSVGGLMTCTCPQRWPALLPRSRYHRPPGHCSITMGNGLPSGICPPGPISSSIASNAISIGAAISISLVMLMVWISCSTSLIDMLIPPQRNCPALRIALSPCARRAP